MKPWDPGYCHFELSEDLAELRDEMIARRWVDEVSSVAPGLCETAGKYLPGTVEQQLWKSPGSVEGSEEGGEER